MEIVELEHRLMNGKEFSTFELRTIAEYIGPDREAAPHIALGWSLEEINQIASALEQLHPAWGLADCDARSVIELVGGHARWAAPGILEAAHRQLESEREDRAKQDSQNVSAGEEHGQREALFLVLDVLRELLEQLDLVAAPAPEERP